MKIKLYLSLVLLSASVFLSATTRKPGNALNQVGFTENLGQITGADGKSAREVLFQASGIRSGMYITRSGLTYVFHQRSDIKASNSVGEPMMNIGWSKAEMNLAGAEIRPENIQTSDPAEGVSNYYYAHCPEGILGVKTWRKVTIRSVYPGIDWVIQADPEKGFAYDFIVHPGADAGLIRLRYQGSNSFTVTRKGESILLHTLYGDVAEGKLYVYGEDGKPVRATVSLANNEVSYRIPNYRSDRELIIDPPLLWSQKELSAGPDYAYSVASALDGTGDVLVTGTSSSSNFPTLNAYQGTNAGNDDIVAFRLNPSGARLWSTYYGGTNFEGGKGISTDVAGNAYITGYTNSTNFPTLSPVQATYGGGTNDVAFFKLNSSGVRQWGSYYGGTGADYSNAIITDAGGNSYITGYTASTNFPVLSAIQGSKSGSNDAFVMKISGTSSVQWATFFGGDDDDQARAIALDPNQTHVFVTGSSVSGLFPVTSGVFQSTNPSAYNAESMFVVKMNTSNAAVQFCTFCGGTGADFGQGIAADLSGNVYLTGYTLSSDFPTLNPGGGAFYVGTIGSAATHDAFITKLNPTGTTLLWSTYYGGSAVDIGYSIYYDATYGVFVTGSSGSTNFPVLQPADNVFYQSTEGDAGSLSDMFIGWFTSAGVEKWSTYYGDANAQEGRGISIDPSGNIFVAGNDSSNIRVIKFAPGLVTGLNTLKRVAAGLQIFPDPVAGNTLYFSCDNQQNGPVRIEILDMLGQTILSNQLELHGKDPVSLDVSQLTSGNYFLLIRLEDAEVLTRKFIKAK